MTSNCNLGEEMAPPTLQSPPLAPTAVARLRVYELKTPINAPRPHIPRIKRFLAHPIAPIRVERDFGDPSGLHLRDVGKIHSAPDSRAAKDLTPVRTEWVVPPSEPDTDRAAVAAVPR
ncbi:hypothetical protein GGF32_004834 [Allomyces javanicus]|nr:hypothetical protein GGF32_004834 [Allomyces javanicus]